MSYLYFTPASIGYRSSVRIQERLKNQRRVRTELLLAIGIGASAVGLVANAQQLGRVLLTIGAIVMTIAIVLWVYATAE